MCFNLCAVSLKIDWTCLIIFVELIKIALERYKTYHGLFKCTTVPGRFAHLKVLSSIVSSSSVQHNTKLYVDAKHIHLFLTIDAQAHTIHCVH